MKGKQRVFIHAFLIGTVYHTLDASKDYLFTQR
jgi:hypothetical protein